MGLEGSVRLGYRRELETVEDPAARQRVFEELLAQAYERGRAVNGAAVFELDDVIDPADTRRWVSASLPAVTESGHRFVATW
jgi:acetyl-CoA carboxylase carboxyltransferase component